MTEEMSKHYEAVIEDMITNGPEWVKGIYDARHTSSRYFMYGIQTILEYIAYNVSEDYYNKFSVEFIENVIKSEEKCLTSEK